jgi:hypothetical protein
MTALTEPDIEAGGEGFVIPGSVPIVRWRGGVQLVAGSTESPRMPPTPARTLATLAALAAVAAVASCSLDQGTNDIFSGIIVYGRVDNEASAAVPGVRMRIGYNAADSCGASFVDLGGTLTTDSAGAYAALVGGYGEPRAVCVKVIATPPADSALAADSIMLKDVQLTQRIGYDSVRINLVLPPK